MVALLGILMCYFISFVDCFNCSTKICPSHLPYCSPVGCLFECPKGSFIDRNSCRTDCGDKYINKNECVDVCPEDLPVVKIQTVVVYHAFVKFQYCMASCPKDTFNLNKTCVRSCPKEYKFAENGNCTSVCSENSYRLNVTSSGKLTAIKCVSSCSFGQFIQDVYCVDSCLPGQVIYNGVCTDECPNNASIKDTDYEGNTFCKSRCDNLYRDFYENGSCVSDCSEYLVIANKECVHQCPKDIPLRFNITYVKPYSSIISKATKCVSSCFGQFIRDDYCVDSCFEGQVIYNGTCIDECPNNAAIKDTDNRGNIFCKSECHDYHRAFLENGYCVAECSKNLVSTIKECVHRCPKETPLRFTDYSGRTTCLNSCAETPGANFIDGDTCVVKCNESSKVYQNTCVLKCPLNAPVIADGKRCEPESFCRKRNDLIYNNSCVDNCPSYATFVYNSTKCMEKCPVDSPLYCPTSYTECRIRYVGYYTYTSRKHKKCLAECPDQFYRYENECLQNCPVETFVSGKECVDNCTKYAPYIYGRTCLNECPSGKTLEGNNCVEDLSTSTAIELPVCKGYEVLDDGKCIGKSQCEKVIVYDGKCTNSCPVGFIYTKVRRLPCIPYAVWRNDTLILAGIFLVILIFTFAFCSMRSCCPCKRCCSKRQDASEANKEASEPMLDKAITDNEVV